MSKPFVCTHTYNQVQTLYKNSHIFSDSVFKIHFELCVYISLWVYAHECRYPLKPQITDFPEARVISTCEPQTWILKVESGFYARAVHTLNHFSSPTPTPLPREFY